MRGERPTTLGMGSSLVCSIDAQLQTFTSAFSNSLSGDLGLVHRAAPTTGGKVSTVLIEGSVGKCSTLLVGDAELVCGAVPRTIGG